MHLSFRPDAVDVLLHHIRASKSPNKLFGLLYSNDTSHHKYITSCVRFIYERLNLKSELAMMGIP